MLEIVRAFKTKISGQPKYKGAIEMLIIGAIAFNCSYSVGLWFDLFMTSS